MRKGWMMVLVLGAVLLGAAALVPDGEADQDTLRTKVARLERNVKAQATVIAIQDQQLKDLTKKVKVLETWLQALPANINALDRGLVLSRDEGFIAAGANPNAREVLLRTLRRFGQGMVASIPKQLPKNRGR